MSIVKVLVFLRKTFINHRLRNCKFISKEQQNSSITFNLEQGCILKNHYCMMLEHAFFFQVQWNNNIKCPEAIWCLCSILVEKAKLSTKPLLWIFVFHSLWKCSWTFFHRNSMGQILSSTFRHGWPKYKFSISKMYRSIFSHETLIFLKLALAFFTPYGTGFLRVLE